MSLLDISRPPLSAPWDSRVHWLFLFATVAECVWPFLQIEKVHRTKSAEDLSAPAVWTFIGANVVFLLAGFYLFRSWAVVLSGLLCVIAGSILISFIYEYA